MYLGWLSLDKLMDPGTNIGAAALAIFVFFMAWLTSVISTRLLRRPIWTVGKLKRKIDQTVIRYITRIKNLVIFLVALLVYASLVPGLRALVGTMVAGAGIKH